MPPHRSMSWVLFFISQEESGLYKYIAWGVFKYNKEDCVYSTLLCSYGAGGVFKKKARISNREKI